MSHDLSISRWCKAHLSRHAAATDTRRAGRRRERAGPAEAPAGVDDHELGESWFDSSRALARGLSVTEHHIGLEVLLRRSAT